MPVQSSDVSTASHPLEPLGAEEIGRASAILREQRDLDPRVRFVSIALQEPPKHNVLNYSGRENQLPKRAA